MRSESGCSFLLQHLSLDSQFVNKRRGCRRSRRSARLKPFATTSFIQTRNMPVTDKARTLSSLISFAIFRLWHFEFKNADAETLLTLIGASVTRAHHHTPAGFFLASEINHGVSDRRIAFHRIRSAPKEEVARF